MSEAYDFVSTDDEPSDDVRRWRLGEHSVDTPLAQDEVSSAVTEVAGVNDDLAEVLSEAYEMMNGGGSSVSGYECPVCGLKHSHSDDKHDIRESFGVRAEFAEQMEYNPFCHCGVNELAMLLDFVDAFNESVFVHDFIIEFDNTYSDIQQAANSAPIPGSTRSAIEELRQDLVEVTDIDPYE